MTPDESVLLDRLADKQGTIRGAVLAGLHTLEADRSAELEARVGELTNKLAKADERSQTDRRRTVEERSALDAQLAEATRAVKAAQAAANDLRADLRETRAKLKREHAARATAEDATRAAQELLVHHAHCAACDKLVPESEWAEQSWRDGIATFHKRHGFREKSPFLGEPASLLFWRQHSAASQQR
jgi:DNA repair exonuclease SbcCD ATPase subunit